MKTTAKTPSPRSAARRQTDGRVRSSRTTPAADLRLLTLTETAVHLGHVHRTTIMRWVREGRLKCIRLSRKAILFEPAELERFVREHRASS